MNNNGLLFFTLGDKFLNLSKLSSEKLIETGNPYLFLTDEQLSIEEIDKNSEWSDISISIPILFNFYHGIELMLKGAISLNEEPNQAHKFSLLIEQYINIYGNNHLIELIKKATLEIPEEIEGIVNPMTIFLAENSINIDMWFHAFKYPAFKEKKFNHINFKYGAKRTIPFWKYICEMSGKISKESAVFYHEITQ